MSVNPFDVKTILLAKHAQHVVLIHFPIAPFTIGVLFDFLAQRTKHSALTAAAYYNFLVAAIATIPVITIGMDDGLTVSYSGPEVRFWEARAPLGANKEFPAHAPA